MSDNEAEKVKSITSWYVKEEFRWRSIGAGVWLLFITPAVIASAIFLRNASILSPLKWLTDSFFTCFASSTFVLCFLLQATSILVALSHVRSIAVRSNNKPRSSRFRFLTFLVQPKQIVNICMMKISALISCALFMKLLVTKSLWSEHETFFSWYPLFLAGYYTITYYWNDEHILHFPHIQQKSFFRFKKSIPHCAYNSFLFTLQVMKIYYPCYLLCDLFFKTMFSAHAISLCYGLLRPSLFWLCFVVSCATVFMLQISNTLVKTFNTQPYKFKFQCSHLTNVSQRSMVHAMQSNNSILLHLAFGDFYNISKFDVSRRSEMFQLSLPGNRPHTWNSISEVCLRHLTDERLKLTKMYDSRQQTTPSTVGPQHLFSTHDNAQNLHKNVLIASPDQPQEKGKFFDDDSNKLPCVKKQEAILLVNMHAIRLCVLGLCNMIAASLKEDTYGVVQRSLPDLIGILLSFYETCQVVSRGLNAHNADAADDLASYTSFLKMTLKTGLYTITSTFDTRLTGIKLPDDQRKKLHGFITYSV